MEKWKKQTPSHHQRSFTSKKQRVYSGFHQCFFLGGFIHKIGFTGVEDRRYIGKWHCKNWLNIETIYIIICIYMILHDMYLCIYNVNTFSKNTCTTYIHHRNKSPCCIFHHFIQPPLSHHQIFRTSPGHQQKGLPGRGGSPLRYDRTIHKQLSIQWFQQKDVSTASTEFVSRIHHVFACRALFFAQRFAQTFAARCHGWVTSFVTSNCRHFPNRHFPSIHFGS